MTAIRQRCVMGIASTICLLACIAHVPSAAAMEPKIAWRVDNPFRLFTESTDTDMHRVTYESLGDDERRQPVLAAERALAERHVEGWAAAMFRRTCWNAAGNKFACPEVADYAHPKSHKIRAVVDNVPDADSIDCTWLTAPGGGGKRGASITVPCNTPVLLEIPYPAGAKITIEVGGQQIAAASAKVQDLFIVAFGDSFGSGEGNPDVPVRFSRDRAADYGIRKKNEAALVGYPARVGSWEQIGDKKFIDENPRWLDQACHRSLYSHQLRAALQLAIEEPHRAVTYAGFACSGAETTFGLFLRYKGHEWVPNPPQLSQVSAAAEVQCGSHPTRANEYPEAYHMNNQVPELKGGLVLNKCDASQARKVDLFFISIGGNDIGFSRLVANAVIADQSQLRSLGGWFGHVHGLEDATAALGRLDDRYKALKRAIHNILHLPWNETDRVVLTAYPPMSIMEDGKSVCPNGQAGMTVLPDFVLSEAKSREGEQAAKLMYDIMKTSAKAHGWSFVDAHVREFQGRGLCAGWTDSALNSADDLRFPLLVDGQWKPFNPADWRPYASRQRWFRTPNDAYLTGHFHVGQGLMRTVMKNQGFDWLQVLLAATYSGAFHPTAEGQAAIADALVEKSRAVIDKYEPRQGTGRRAER